MKKTRTRIEICGDWFGGDRELEALAAATGFKTIPRLARHVLNEVSGIKTPAQFYRALSRFHDEKAHPKV
jgi:hypothetical protein